MFTLADTSNNKWFKCLIKSCTEITICDINLSNVEWEESFIRYRWEKIESSQSTKFWVKSFFLSFRTQWPETFEFVFCSSRSNMIMCTVLTSWSLRKRKCFCCLFWYIYHKGIYKIVFIRWMSSGLAIQCKKITTKFSPLDIRLENDSPLGSRHCIQQKSW